MIEKIEQGKRRNITIMEGDCSYSEANKTVNDELYTEFLTLTKGSTYSFSYFNGSFQDKVGHFTIENDSKFIQPFVHLMGNDKTIKVMDASSERFIEFSKSEHGDVNIAFHLLSGEIDGTVELTDMRYDFRSSADNKKTNLTERFTLFFDELIELVPKLEDDLKGFTKQLRA